MAETTQVEQTQEAQADKQGTPSFVANARKRIEGLEKDLLERGKAQQKEIQALLKGVMERKEIKALEKQAGELSEEVRRRVDGLQGRVLVALGVASRSEIEQIHTELMKLSKTVEELVTKKSGPSA